MANNLYYCQSVTAANGWESEPALQHNDNDGDFYDKRLQELTRKIYDLQNEVIPRCGEEPTLKRHLAESKKDKELILERRRVSQIVDAFQPPREEFSCHSCNTPLIMVEGSGYLEANQILDGDSDSDIDINHDNRILPWLSFLYCCGEHVCMACFGDYLKRKCPCCETATFPCTEEEKNQKLFNLAESGNCWGQYYAATTILNADRKEAARLLVQAATGGARKAAECLVIEWKREDAESPEEYRQWLELGANSGVGKSQMLLGVTLDDESEEEEDQIEAVKWYTLAVAQGGAGSEIAACNLSQHFKYGTGGVEKSLVRQIYYLEIAAKSGDENAQYDLSRALCELGFENFGIPGCSLLPRCLYWAKESMKSGSSDLDATKIIKTLHDCCSETCANCPRKANLRCCSRCKVFWFCSKDCQREYWRDGHKLDCVGQNAS